MSNFDFKSSVVESELVEPHLFSLAELEAGTGNIPDPLLEQDLDPDPTWKRI